uniref:Uncharacterized protein n=1 Tax=Meloidogyne incognita TaxID=6306 RepID=A0A914LC67_MELIC
MYPALAQMNLDAEKSQAFDQKWKDVVQKSEYDAWIALLEAAVLEVVADGHPNRLLHSLVFWFPTP